MNSNTIARNPGIQDYGGKPLIVNIDLFAKVNPYYRIALWTGEHLQVTLMSIPVGGDIGLEMHPDTDQFIRVESGYALAKMGKSKDSLTYQGRMDSNYAVIVPAGTWHNVINIGNAPLKLYSVYAPPQHPFGTIHETKEIAEREEKN
jgi:mannose-6-phosphate isomerase-like protein (cupin superfamily)